MSKIILWDRLALTIKSTTLTLKTFGLIRFQSFYVFFRFFGILCQGSHRVWKTWKMGCFLKKSLEKVRKSLVKPILSQGQVGEMFSTDCCRLMTSLIRFYFSLQSSYFCYYHLLGIGKCKVSLILVLIFSSQIPKLSPIWNEFIDSVKNCLE